MTRWHILRLDAVCEVTSSKRIYAKELSATGVPFYRSKEIIEKLSGQPHSTPLFISEQRFEEILRQTGAPIEGDLLLTSRGTLGLPYLVTATDRFHFADGNLTWFRHFNGLDSAFLKYFFLSPAGKAELARCVIGSSQPAYTIAALKKISIPMPPLRLQQQIASVLLGYDDLIEVNRRRIAVLEEMARRLFEEWFVHFRFPGHEGRAMVDTPDGPLPEGWRAGVLGELIELAYGRALKADVRVPGKVSVIGSSGVVGWHNEALVKGPGIVVGRKGNVGAIIWSPIDFYPIDTVFFVETTRPLLFVLYQLRRLTFLNSDAAVPGLNRNAALRMSLKIPPEQLMKEYDQKVKPMMILIDQLRQMNFALASSRDLLLPRLISGELSVESAERELEAVA